MTTQPLHPAGNRGPRAAIEELRRKSYDEADFKERLSDEYKILQDKIDKIGAFRFTIKGWSVTAVVACIATTGGKGLANDYAVSLGLVLLLVFFMLLEYEQVRQSRLFGDRAGRIEDAFRRISRGKGQEEYAALPVPYTAHELVLERMRETPSGHSSESIASPSLSEAAAKVLHTLGRLHSAFYFTLILLALLSLLPQYRAIADHWREFKQNFNSIPPRIK